MNQIVCTVTPTVQEGTVVRWYRSEITAERNRPMASASRNGLFLDEEAGFNGHIPEDVLAKAEQAHRVLSGGGSGDELVNWATHRRERVFGGTLVPVSRA